MTTESEEVTGTPRVAVVTGAARASARPRGGLARAGWSVVAVDRCADDPRIPYALGTRAELDEVVVGARLGRGDAPGGVVAHVADTTDEAGLAAAVAEAETRFGGLDAMVAVAGVIAGVCPCGRCRPTRSRPCSRSICSVRSWPPGWRSRRSSAARRPSGALPGRRVGGGDQRTAPARRLRRGQGRRRRTGPGPGGGPGRHRDHRQRRGPRLHRHGHAGRERPPLRPRRDRVVRRPAARRTPPLPRRGGRGPRMAGRSRPGRRHGCRPPGGRWTDPVTPR